LIYRFGLLENSILSYSEKVDNKMKILIVTPFFPPIIGGVETVLDTTCSALASRGHEVKVLTSPVKGSPSNEKMGAFLVQRSQNIAVPDNGYIQPDKFDFYQTASFIQDVADDFEPDVVHFHNYQMRQYAMFLSAFLQGLGRKYPTIDTLHNDSDDSFSQYLVSYLPLDQIVCVTKKSAMELLMAGVSSSKLSIIPNMIDSERFRSAKGTRIRSRLGVGPDEHLILFPSRIMGREGNLLIDPEKGKGLSTLIQSLSEVVDADPTAKVLLLGNDPVFFQKIVDAKTKLYEIVRKTTGKDCLLFLDETIPNSALPEIFAASDLVVSLSARETFGMVFVEGMSAGRPVVGVNSRSGGVSEVFPDAVAGYLVPPNDAHSTARSILKILLDDELRAQFGLNGIKWVGEKFDVKVVLPNLVSLYSNLANSSKTRATQKTISVPAEAYDDSDLI
jgi:glycosyltransferase involved in cell wall biosynthesis